MRHFLIYNLATGRVRQKIDCDSEALAQASVFDGEGCLEVDEGTPDSGLVVTAQGVEAVVSSGPVESDAVRIMRAERTSMLNHSAWTQAADAPLTDACREAFRQWRVSLHRWLVDHPDGLTPLPAPPPIDYRPLAEQV